MRKREWVNATMIECENNNMTENEVNEIIKRMAKA